MSSCQTYPEVHSSELMGKTLDDISLQWFNEGKIEPRYRSLIKVDKNGNKILVLGE